MTPSFRGILPALVTPFDEAEDFQAKPLEVLLERVYGAGVHGVYVCGQTGEGLLQPVAQRKRVAEVAVRNSPPGAQTIIHIGCHRTADAVELTRHAGRIGAYAVSSLPPVGVSTFAEIRSYYQAIAAVADVPVLIYYFPELCPRLSKTEQILELAAIPQVVGLKFTDFNLYLLSMLRRSGLVVFNGRDEVLAAGLLMGASGGVGTFYNLVPRWFVEVFELCEAGRYTDAVLVQKRINELIQITLRFPVFSAVKLMLKWSGIDCGMTQAPSRQLSDVEAGLLRQALEQAGMNPEETFGQPTPVSC
jgi:N-acetylneuraminate lyase